LYCLLCSRVSPARAMMPPTTAPRRAATSSTA
jgi:hypothetical protein